MTDIEKADVLRKAAEIMSTEWGSEPIDEMREYADALDPPYKLDCSLRGEVLVVNSFGQRSMMYADKHGIGYWSKHGTRYVWDIVGKYGWKVTKLHILQPGEVTVKIPPVSEWPEETYTYTVGGWFRNYIYRHQRVVTRDEAERREDKRMMLYSKNDLGQEESQ